MTVLYDIELLLTLLIGGAIGVLVTAGHFEQNAHRRWAYEKELAEGREMLAALAMYRRIRPARSFDDEERPA